ncbi:MAG: DUF4476 domain-containing protein [Bacteroidia bacterium]
MHTKCFFRINFKYIFLVGLFFLSFSSIKAQIVNNLVVFCNDSRFTLILNGLKENETPQTNVRVVGLDLKVYEVKVIFENRKLKDHTNKITFFRTGKECVFALNKHGRRKHTLDYVSEKEIDGFLPPVNNDTTAHVYSNTQTNNTNTINATQFQTTLSNIIAQPTEEGKLKAALASLENTTFSVEQVKNIFITFSTPQKRLAFAKQLWAKAKDPSIYTNIIDTFLTEALRGEFNLFIQGRK